MLSNYLNFILFTVFSSCLIMKIRDERSKFLFFLGYLLQLLYGIGIVIVAVLNVLHPGIAIIGIVIIFESLIIAFFSAVLKKLLRSAIELKSKNEFTDLR